MQFLFHQVLIKILLNFSHILIFAVVPFGRDSKLAFGGETRQLGECWCAAKRWSGLAVRARLSRPGWRLVSPHTPPTHHQHTQHTPATNAPRPTWRPMQPRVALLSGRSMFGLVPSALGDGSDWRTTEHERAARRDPLILIVE